MCKRNIYQLDQLALARPQLGTWPATQACALTKNQISDLSVRKPALSPLSHTSQSLTLSFPWVSPVASRDALSTSTTVFHIPSTSPPPGNSLSLPFCLPGFSHPSSEIKLLFITTMRSTKTARVQHHLHHRQQKI